MSTHLSIPFIVWIFTVIGVALACVGLLATIWLRAGFAAIGAIVRTAHRLGLYDPGRSQRRSGRPSGAERFIRRFTRALRAVSRVLPGRTREHSHTIIVPLVLVGIPVFLLALLVVWAVPATLFGYVLSAGPAPWSSLLAVLSLGAYFGVAILLWHVGAKASLAAGAARGWLGRE